MTLPLRPGSWVHQLGEHRHAGSFGLVVRDLTHPDHPLVGLAAAHTLAPLGVSRVEASVRAAPPNFQTAGGILDADVGHVLRSTLPADDVTADAAAFTAFASVEMSNDVIIRRRTEFKLGGIRRVELGEEITVFKFGARTHLTRGVLVGLPVQAVLRDRTGFLRYSLGYAISGVGGHFSLPGDSGAAVFDEDGQVVGLLGGLLGTFDIHSAPPELIGEARSLCLPIEAALSQLAVALPASL